MPSSRMRGRSSLAEVKPYLTFTICELCCWLSHPIDNQTKIRRASGRRRCPQLLNLGQIVPSRGPVILPESRKFPTAAPSRCASLQLAPCPRFPLLQSRGSKLPATPFGSRVGTPQAVAPSIQRCAFSRPPLRQTRPWQCSHATDYCE